MAVTGLCVAGGRIVSSKPFAPLNFRINSRNLSGKLWAQWYMGFRASCDRSDGALPGKEDVQLAAPQPLITVHYPCCLLICFFERRWYSKKAFRVQSPAAGASLPAGLPGLGGGLAHLGLCMLALTLADLEA